MNKLQVEVDDRLTTFNVSITSCPVNILAMKTDLLDVFS
jgi:hypothetical protein